MLEFILLVTLPAAIYVYTRGLKHVVVHQRWIFVCLFLMPLSVLFEAWLKIRNWIVFKISSAPQLHEARVKEIQADIEKWNKEGCKTKMCTARPGWQTVSLRVGKYKATHKRVNINLMDVLAIDENRKVVRVEPLATMGQISNTLIPLGWTLPVVPELDALTVGGLIMGCGIETSSFKYGLFQHICVSYDVIVSDGSLIHCSKEENTDLFYHMPWSHGTLGFLVAAEIRIIPAKKYVKLNYRPIKSLEDATFSLKEAVKDEKLDFVECLSYSLNEHVLMTGRLTDNFEDSKINNIGLFWKPWFFKHVEMFSKQDRQDTEYIPLRDYYHRHTRGIFWEIQDIIPFGNYALFRYLFGWAMPPQISLLKLTSPQFLLEMYELEHVVQDMLLPINCLPDAIHFFEQHLKIYPLWLCPFRLFNAPGIVHLHDDVDDMYIDIGAYGTPKQKSFNGPDTIKQMESFVLQKNGYQMLYADSYLSLDDFRKMFDHTTYDVLRNTYNADAAFPTIYEKVCRTSRR